ncbi:Heparinase II/III-like protein [Cyclobacterium xiamenense]|uniref:Heparinase II/III-like protein n=1 Tax=Cyclobacterium xiamenense TaxID=1297121 RepID=A0A1H7AW98_9BACT|nr:alginate lyase family protein [Cyclobacterium xiamenense]SEJ69216.1 Heparinase II/III-like protein [Cyclobacterium xiamenense]
MIRTFCTALFSLLLFLGAIGISPAQQPWEKLHTTADLYEAHPEILRGIFSHLDLDLPELAAVKAARDQGDWVEAADKLLAYYAHSPVAQSLARDLPDQGNGRIAAADTILQDVFTIQNVKGKVPILPDGHRDWYYKGPNNDREWAWLSNRHSQLLQVMDAYFETGNPEYAVYMDRFLRDFILKSMPYPAEKGTESIWRGLEVAARAKAWTRLFYAMNGSTYLRPATRLLLLSSLPDHAHYNRHFHGGNNWLTMEISALATVAAYFPEFKDSDAWLDYAIGAMTESMRDQVYPDGVQTELTSHYHNVSLHNFELFQSICEVAGRELPAFFPETIQRMYGYIARAVRPDGYRILNNDGDRGSDRELILRGADAFDRPDWAYIASNGKNGSLPSDGPSYFFPWAGQLISRSGFDSLAHWSFFDMGPWGSGHQHNDKLHLSVSAFGQDFLVDAGRFAYTGALAEKFRPYARGSQGHNVLLLDGKGQGSGPTHASSPLDRQFVEITERYDFGSQSFDRFEGLEGEVSHSRSLLYLRGKFWLIADRISSDRPRMIQALWHWHPDIALQLQGLEVAGSHSGGSLTLSLVSGPSDVDLRSIRGQEIPEIQGWYSPEYNRYEPNTLTSFELRIPATQTLVWLLLPRSSSSGDIAYRARVLSETETYVTVEVQVGRETWELLVPFSDRDKLAVSQVMR